MAHSNIEERRFFVNDLLTNGKNRAFILQEASFKFGCSTSAIDADVATLRGQKRKRKYKKVSSETTGFRLRIYSRDGKVCQYCTSSHGRFNIEHIVPISRGGEYLDENMVVACTHCNYAKKAQIWIPINFDTICMNNLEFMNYVISRSSRDFRDGII